MTRALLAGLALAVAACGDNQDPDAAAALWQEIHDLDYRSFARAPGYEMRRPSDTAHASAVDIYVNGVMQAVLAAADPVAAWPVGSLVVKDGFDGDDLELVAVLKKEAGGWFYAEYDAGGSAKYSGQPDLCLDCHSAGRDATLAFSPP